MNRTFSLAAITALALVSASSSAFAPPVPKTPTTTITIARNGAATLSAAGVQVAGGWKVARTSVQASGAMAANLLAVTTSIGKIDSYTAQLDGMAASTVGAPSFAIVRPFDVATGQTSGKFDGGSITLHRTATTSDDWKTWMTTHGPVKGLALRALSAGSDVRAFAFSQCGASSYDFVANADGTFDDTLVVACSPTNATATGGVLAPLFADLVSNRALGVVTVTSTGRTAISFPQGSVSGYSFANGTETYSLFTR